MFNPNQEDVRRFFCLTFAKARKHEVMTPLETLAMNWINQHPEYEADLADEERAVGADYSVENGQTNPFLHLSMHLTITEQVSIDQPAGIRNAFERLAIRLDSEHLAAHEIMECLGEMIWQSQRSGQPPDGVAYIEAVKRRAQ
jgi:hypothetical protein